MYDQLPHLVAQRFVRDSWIRLGQRNEGRSKFYKLARELSGQCWEYELKVSSVFEVPRTEEGGPKLTVREQPLCDRLRNCTLPRSGQPIQPVDGGLARIPRPMFNFVQDGSTGSFQTTFTIAVPVLCPLCRAETIDDSCFVCWRFASGVRHREQKVVLTWALERGYSICSDEEGEHSQSVYTLARKPPSVVFVNVSTSAIGGHEQTW